MARDLSPGSKSTGAKDTEYAKGGGSLGRTREFMKTPDEFRNPDGGDGANSDNKYAKSGEGAGTGDWKPPAQADKSAKNTQSNVSGNAGSKGGSNVMDDGKWGKSGDGHTNMSGGEAIPGGSRDCKDSSCNVHSEGRYAKQGRSPGATKVQWASTPGKGDEGGY